MSNTVKRVILAVVGVALLLIGVLLLALPGPGMLLVLAGLIALSVAFPQLERHLQPVRDQALKAADASVSSPWHIVGSVLVGVALISAGIVWGVLEELPLGGWPAGSALVSSGVVLLALLVYSYRRAARRRDS